MNTQIRRLFTFVAVALVAVLGMAAYWLWRSPELEARQGNPTLVVRQLTIQRGLITRPTVRCSRATGAGSLEGRTIYVRRYPTDGLLSQTVGYSTVSRSRAGLERSMNDFLTGSNDNLSTVIDRITDKVKGLTQRGNSLVLTVDMAAQRVAMEQLADVCGAAVALEPATGRVLAMASSPTYDQNLVEDDFGRILSQQGPCRPAAPLLNRASAGLFIPGSTFKVVTAAAALESGVYTPESEFDDKGYCERVRQESLQLRRSGRPRGVRARHARRGARALDQRRLLRHRQGARPGAGTRDGGEVRLLRETPARDARPTSARRAASTGGESSTSRTIRTTSIRVASPSDRSACS